MATGLYSVEVTQTAAGPGHGCKAFLPHTLPTTLQPVVRITSTNSTVCSPAMTDNGTIALEIENPAGAAANTQYTIDLLRGGVSQITPINSLQLTPTTLSSTLSPGTYVVRVASPGICTVNRDVTIGQDARPPIISSTSIVSNTSCSVNALDGQVVLRIARDPLDITTPNFVEVYMSSVPASLPAITATEATIAAFATTAGGGGYPTLTTAGQYVRLPNGRVYKYKGGGVGTVTNYATAEALVPVPVSFTAAKLDSGSYSFVATNAATGCTANKTFTVLDAHLQPELRSVTINNAEFCDLSLERSASATVAAINVAGSATTENMNHYQFNWYNAYNEVSFTATATTDKINATGHPFLNGNKVLLTISGAFPLGLLPNAEYVVKNAGVNDFELSLTAGGPTIDITVNGAGKASKNLLTAMGNSAAGGGDEFSNTVGHSLDSIVTNRAYYAMVTKITDGAPATGGLGCTSVPFKVIIGDGKVKPSITLSPTGNNSCNPTFFGGSIEVDVVTASGAGAASTYSYEWTPTSAAGLPVNGSGNSGVDNIFTGTKDGTYSLKVKNSITGCENTMSTTVIREAPPVFTLDAHVMNWTLCTLPFNGAINNVSVSINTVSGTKDDFDYVWFKTDLSTKVLDGEVRTVTVEDELTSTTYPSIGIGSYFLKAIRKTPFNATQSSIADFAAASASYTFNTGDYVRLSNGEVRKYNGGTRTDPTSYAISVIAGAGCESTVIQRDILDARAFPQLEFSSTANTACSSSQWDGSITVKAGTAGFGAGTEYDFDWTSNPATGGVIVSDRTFANGGTQIASMAGIPLSLATYISPASDRIAPGAYNITVTNRSNSCLTSGSTIVQNNTLPIVATATANPLTNCITPDASVSVTGITIGNPPSPANLADFSYSWTGPGGPFTTQSVSNSAPGDYTVTITKNSATAFGCSSVPVTVRVENRQAFPQLVEFSSVPNTACITPVPHSQWDGSITVIAGTAGFGAGTEYDFDWTSNPATGGVIVSDRTVAN
ncbi:MAG: hypothetical protein ORN54_09660, partial [Cyclobacteriaceae bacterium]|nr:hypothetical protein [Cyclobacteriaceae bacterium]